MMLQKVRDRFDYLKDFQGFQKYFHNTKWLFISHFFKLTLGVFVGVWVARYLGPDRYGLLSYSVAFVGLFSAIASLGLDEIVIREIVKFPENKNVYLGSAFILKIAGSFLIFTLLFFLVYFTSKDRQGNLLILIIAGSTIFGSFSVIDLYFQANVLSKYSVFANILSLLASSIFKILLVLYKFPLIYFAFPFVFNGLILAIGYIYFYNFINRKNYPAQSIIKGNRLLNWKFDTKIAIRLLKYSWPLILSGTTLMFHARIDQVMLKMMVGNTETGYYSVAIRLIEIFGFIPIILSSSLFPYVMKVEESLKSIRLSNYYRLNFILFLLVAVPIFIFSKKVIILLFGYKYEQSAVLLSLLSIRLFFTNMGVARGMFILKENLLKYSLITMIIGMLTNIIFNFLLIPMYKAEGSIIATFFSFFVTIFLIDIFYKKTRSNVILMFKSIITFYKISI